MSGPVSFDRVADRYDASRGGPSRAAHFAVAFVPWVLRGTLLEIGVGTGIVANALAQRGVPVIGVDISADMLAGAHRRLGPRVARADARHLPVRDAAVAGVLFSMVLHVVGDVPAAFAEATRVLRPSGRLIAVHARPDADPTDLTKALETLEFRRQRPDSDDLVDAAAAAAGLSLEHRGWTAWADRTQTPNEVADGVEQRLWSYLWRMDDAAWERDALPAIRALRARPSPDRPRAFRDRHRLSVWSSSMSVG
jgi:SAM-dependent methyltransferase